MSRQRTPSFHVLFGSHLCLLTTLLSFLQVGSLSTTPTIKSPTIERVAIIGGGIAGLSLAHALTNSPTLAKTTQRGSQKIQVTLFDARPSFDFNAGSGVQLNGGMSVLRKINPEVQRAVANAGLPLKSIGSRARPWRNDGVPYDTLLEFDLEAIVREEGGRTEEELIVDGEPMFYSIMRGALQEALIKTLPKNVFKQLEFGKALNGIDKRDDGRIEVRFEDGSSVGPFDMVVGCDGVNSAVKEFVETGKISKDGSNRRRGSAIYSGIRIRYAVNDGDPSSKASSARLLQYFGEGGYGLSGVYGAGEGRPSRKSAFITFLDNDYFGPFKKPKARSSEAVKENADWTQDVQSPASSREVMMQQMKDCRIPALDMVPVIETADRFFELGVYFHNPFSCSGWSREVPGSGGRYCTLVGDAAHAMPPFLGQGSNQAIQDSYCLAKKIYEHNARSTGPFDVATGDREQVEEGNVTLETLLKEYEQLRWATTTSISVKAGLLGYLEAGSEGFPSRFRDVFFSTLFRLGIAKKVFLGAATPNV